MIDFVGGIYRAGVHEGLMEVRTKIAEARAKELNIFEVLKKLEPTPEEKAEAEMYKKFYLTKGEKKTKADVILAQKVRQEINQAVREYTLRAFEVGAELLKKIGASPEDIAKFQALYPPRENNS